MWHVSGLDYVPFSSASQSCTAWYRGGMTQPDEATRDQSAALLAEHGFFVTEEGKARARAKLAEMDAHWTPERRQALRERLAHGDAA